MTKVEESRIRIMRVMILIYDKVLIALYISNEWFSCAWQTAWPEDASIVEDTHWLVAWVSRYSHMIVLNYILFNEGFTSLSTLGLWHSSLINLSLWQKSIITWNMRCSFGCSNPTDKVIDNQKAYVSSWYWFSSFSESGLILSLGLAP